MKQVLNAALIVALVLVCNLVWQTLNYKKIASAENRVQIVLRGGRILNAEAISFAPHAIAVFADGGVSIVDGKQVSKVSATQ
jgi:NADH dehydrogenase FAD-containing subunit